MDDIIALFADLAPALGSLPVREDTSPDICNPVTENDGGPPDGPPEVPPGGQQDGEPPEGGDEIDWVTLHACAAEPDTDIGNGRRLLIRHRDDMLFVENLEWFVYDGRRWKEDVGGQHTRPLTHHTAEKISLERLVIPPTVEEEAAIKAGEEALADLKVMEEAAVANKADEAEKLEMRRLRDRIAQGKAAADAVRKRRAGRITFAKRSASTNALNNMMHEARPYVTCPLDALDADPLAMNLENGTLKLIKGERSDPRAPIPWTVRLDPHNREDRISKLMPVAYDPDAKCPQFEKFLDRVQPYDATQGHAVLEFIRRYLGYSLTGLTQEQVLVFFFGGGRNGKSTLVDIVARIMGDYSASLPFETLAGDDRRRGSDATPDLVRIPGARLVRASEPEQGMDFREAMVKSLTSGEPILVRPLNKGFNEVYPTFKLVISGNHKPAIKGGDDGIWRRFLLVPWEQQIPKEEVDKALPDKLWEERSGILNWLLEGLITYLEHGLMVPETVRAATDSYREESDPITAFLSEAVTLGPAADPIRPQEMVDAFSKYLVGAGLTPWKPTTFTKRLPLAAKRFGLTRRKTGGLWVYDGGSLKYEYTSAGLAGASNSQGYGDKDG
ncbi:MAG: phage/plasmid primase, P4 family [Pseudomonadota bacterium]